MDVLIFVKNVRRSSYANCDTARTTLPCSFVKFFLNDNTFDKNVVKLRQGPGKDRQGMAVKAKGLKA